MARQIEEACGIMNVSPPYRTLQQRRSADWLVVVRTAAGVEVHRFTRRENADSWLQELADHPELDTNDRELDARREAAAERNHR